MSNSTDYGEWLDRVLTLGECIAPEPSQRLALALDQDHTGFMDGSPLPLLRHWLHFIQAAPQSDLGADGHPEKGGFLPPVPLPRRMWAAGSLRFHAPLCIGDKVIRRSRIKSVTPREGRSGQLVFVTLEHTLHRGPKLLLEEQQDIVYRESGAPAGEGRPAAESCDWSRELVPDSTLLFRYSALTFNAHRIHYDRDYARDEEGYPEIVVQGPLTATLLLDALKAEVPDVEITGFSFRGVAPLYANAPLVLTGRREGGDVTLQAVNASGNVAMEASATLA